MRVNILNCELIWVGYVAYVSSQLILLLIIKVKIAFVYSDSESDFQVKDKEHHNSCNVTQTILSPSVLETV